MTVDNRSQEIVFLPACAICQAFMARGIVKQNWHGVIKPLLRLLLDYDLNLVQMPCPESCFGGVSTGLQRGPKGYSAYNKRSFKDHCRGLADDMVALIRAFHENGYRVVCILGIENSPSCAVWLQRSRRGVKEQPGIFMGMLREGLDCKGLRIPMVGINRRAITHSVEEVRSLLQNRPKLAQEWPETASACYRRTKSDPDTPLFPPGS